VQFEEYGGYAVGDTIIARVRYGNCDTKATIVSISTELGTVWFDTNSGFAFELEDIKGKVDEI